MGFQLNTSVLNQKGSPAIYTDTFANRPAFGYAGRLFISNDTAAIYEDTGTAWVLIANVSSGAGTLQQVTTNGNTSNVGISVTAGGVSTNSATITSLTQGSVPFVGAAGLITQDNTNLFFDDTNNRLGINTNTPSNNLDVHGTGTNPLIAINNTAGNQSLIAFAKNSTAKWRIGNSSTDFFEILNVALTTNAIRISSANNSTVFISSVQADDFLIQPTGYSLLASLSRNLTGTGYGVLTLRNSANGTIQPSSLTVDRTYTLPDATGTIALTSDLSAYLPLAGGTMTGPISGTQLTLNFNPQTSLLSGYNYLNFGGGSIMYRNNTDVYIGSNAKYGSAGTTIANYTSANGMGMMTMDGGTLNYQSIDTSVTAGTAYGMPVRFTCKPNGNFLIGSTTDDTVNKLQVTGSIKATGSVNLVTGNSFQWDDGSILFSSGGNLSFWTNSIKRFEIFSTGITRIINLAGTGLRTVLADANGDLSAPVSDQSVKENIKPLKYGLDTIMKLNAVQFEFKEGFKNYGEGLQIGAIAQEVEQIIPEAVFKTISTGLKGIDYNQFNGIYIKAIQDQQKIIESLIQRIELLENK